VIKESRYLEIKPVYLQLNAPLLVLAGLNDITPIEKSHKMKLTGMLVGELELNP